MRNTILAALLYGTPAAGVSHTRTSQRCTRNGVAEFAEGDTYIQHGGHHVGQWALAHILVILFLFLEQLMTVWL